MKIENVYYAFFKADIGNNTLKRTCGTIGCVNPYHHRSRFEVSNIRQKVKSGFNNKLKSIEDLSNAEWLRLPQTQRAAYGKNGPHAVSWEVVVVFAVSYDL